MTKLMVGIVCSFMVCSAFADLTQFRWRGGSLVDHSGGVIPYGQATVFTILDNDASPDIMSMISGNRIDLVDLHAFSAYSIDSTVGPHWEEGQLHTGNIIGDGAVAGLFAYAVVADGAFNSIEELGFGDYIGVVNVGHLIVDLQPDPAWPVDLPQEFNPGHVQTGTSAFQTDIQVIPEPATLGLMAVAGLGAFLTRRKARA